MHNCIRLPGASQLLCNGNFKLDACVNCVHAHPLDASGKFTLVNIVDRASEAPRIQIVSQFDEIELTNVVVSTQACFAEHTYDFIGVVEGFIRGG